MKLQRLEKPSEKVQHTPGMQKALYIQYAVNRGFLWMPSLVSYLLIHGHFYQWQGPFFDIKQLPWYPQLKREQNTIIQECLTYINQNLQENRQYQPINFVPALRQQPFSTAGVYRNFQQTLRILTALPDFQLVVAKMCVLYPGQSLKLHHDMWPHVINVHLVLDTPAGANLLVEKECLALEDHQIYAFNPAFLHAAWNNGDRPRWILNLGINHGGCRSAAYLYREIGYFFTETVVPWVSGRGRYYLDS